MISKILFSGSGGQGIQLVSRVFCQACVEEGFNVSLIPSYGAEMRGGNTTCKIVISKNEVASPLFDIASYAMLLSELAFKTFQNITGEKGTLLVDDSIKGHDDEVENAIHINAVRIADNEIENSKVMNMVALGAFIKATGLIKKKSAETAIKIVFKDKNANLINKNLEALETGYKHGVM